MECMLHPRVIPWKLAHDSLGGPNPQVVNQCVRASPREKENVEASEKGERIWYAPLLLDPLLQPPPCWALLHALFRPSLPPFWPPCLSPPILCAVGGPTTCTGSLWHSGHLPWKCATQPFAVAPASTGAHYIMAVTASRRGAGKMMAWIGLGYVAYCKQIQFDLRICLVLLCHNRWLSCADHWGYAGEALTSIVFQRYR